MKYLYFLTVCSFLFVNSERTVGDERPSYSYYYPLITPTETNNNINNGPTLVTNNLTTEETTVSTRQSDPTVATIESEGTDNVTTGESTDRTTQTEPIVGTTTLGTTFAVTHSDRVTTKSTTAASIAHFAVTDVTDMNASDMQNVSDETKLNNKIEVEKALSAIHDYIDEKLEEIGSAESSEDSDESVGDAISIIGDKLVYLINKIKSKDSSATNENEDDTSDATKMGSDESNKSDNEMVRNSEYDIDTMNSDNSNEDDGKQFPKANIFDLGTFLHVYFQQLVLCSVSTTNVTNFVDISQSVVNYMNSRIP